MTYGPTLCDSEGPSILRDPSLIILDPAGTIIGVVSGKLLTMIIGCRKIHPNGQIIFKLQGPSPIVNAVHDCC
jgi:hypothetical protein